MTTGAGYIALPVTVNPKALVQAAIASIQAKFPGWVPYEGQLDLAILEEAALMMSVPAQAAAQVPLAIFEYLGPLVGVTPIKGSPATAPVTFTMRDDAGYSIPAGFPIAYPLSGSQTLIFTVDQTIVVPAGETTASGTLVCATVGTFANDLAPATCQLVQSFAQVDSVATTAASSGGVNADTTASYINRLSSELQLMAPRPILPGDFAAMAPNVPGVYRALAINGLNPGRTVAAAAVTSGSKTVTCATGRFSTLDVGRKVSGFDGIPGTTTVASVQAPTRLTLSADATVTSASTSLALGDLRTQERCITVCGLTSAGEALTATETAALLAYLRARREVNFLVFTIAPTVTDIDVSVTVEIATGATGSAVQAAVAAAIDGFLSPANWGGGTAQVPQWSNTATTVRFLDVANVIRQVPGVLWIAATALKLAIHGDALGQADVVLPGDAPLPSPGTVTVTTS